MVSELRIFVMYVISNYRSFYFIDMCSNAVGRKQTPTLRPEVSIVIIYTTTRQQQQPHRLVLPLGRGQRIPSAPAALTRVQKLEQPPSQAPDNVKIKPWTAYGSYPHLPPIVVAATFQAIAFVSEHLEPLQSASKRQETGRATLALAVDGATINDEDAISSLHWTLSTIALLSIHSLLVIKSHAQMGWSGDL